MNGTILRILLAGLAAGTAARAGEADLPTYTMEECVRIGFRQATAIRNARRDEVIAESRIRQTRAQVLPQFSARAEYTRLDETPAMTFDGERVEMGRPDNYSASAEASQLLYSGGSVRAALRAARSYRDLKESAVRQSENELVRDIRAGFADILLAERAVEVQAASVAQLSNLAAQAEAKYRQQTASEYDTLTARVRLANEAPELIRARKDAQLAKASFRDLVQLGPGDYALSGELEFRPDARRLEDWMAVGLARRPELLQQRKWIDLLDADVRAERGGYQPQVRARAAYTGQNPESGSAADEWTWGWNAGLTVEWSLFDGGLRSGRVLEKALEAAKARDDLGDLERAVALDIEQAFLDKTQAAETVAASRETVALAEKGLEIARARYDSGLATYLEYTDANLALSTARLTWLTALHDHMNALARLECACGGGAEPFTGETP